MTDKRTLALAIVVLLLSIYGLLPTFKALSISSADREAARDNPERLAEIAERRGDVEAASARRAAFDALWTDADPDLRPVRPRALENSASATPGTLWIPRPEPAGPEFGHQRKKLLKLNNSNGG